MECIGLNIRNIRQVWGLSQEVFGVVFSATRGMINQYESGNSRPNNVFAARLAKMLGISKEELKQTELDISNIPKIPEEVVETVQAFKLSSKAEKQAILNSIKDVEEEKAYSPKKEVIALGKKVPNRLSPEEFAQAFPDWEGVPVYNTEVTASFVTKYNDDDNKWEPLYYLRDPQFSKCNFAARIAGDSMHSEIRHGDYIICQEVEDIKIIVFGEIYFVVTSNGLETCKYINAVPVYDPNYKGKHQLYDYSKVLLVPKNDSISPTPIDKSDIVRLYRVKGIVRGY